MGAVAADLEVVERYLKFHAFDRIAAQLYPKQREFIALGGDPDIYERMFSAGNQFGKSDTGAFEMACHLTGNYPSWWEGYRFDRPIKAWAAGPSGGMVRGAGQTKLFGDPMIEEDFGTGFIPRHLIVGKPTQARGVPGLYDTAQVRHKSGGISTVRFMTYEMERYVWQGAPIDLIWFDEEPTMDLYSEGLARLGATKGKCYMTFTPLKGMSEVATRFFRPADYGALHRRLLIMDIEDCPHMLPELEKLKAQYPEWQWPMRIHGIPNMSEGQIFTTPEANLRWQCIDFAAIPAHYAKIWGIDFGTGHPFAAVLYAIDRERGSMNAYVREVQANVPEEFRPKNTSRMIAGSGHAYLLQALRMEGMGINDHVAAMNQVARGVPVAWPRDGHNRINDGGGLAQMAEIYRRAGLNMLGTHAKYDDQKHTYSTEAGIADLDYSMRLGMFHVNENCEKWFGEYRNYRREVPKNGGSAQIVKKGDDLMSATRIGWMARRFAVPMPLGSRAVSQWAGGQEANLARAAEYDPLRR
jgi:phage terminase large subunit-like protein